MGDTGSGSHHLNFAGADNRTRTHTVLVRERTLEHIREDFHVPMTVRSESCTRNDAVVVDHPKQPLRDPQTFLEINGSNLKGKYTAGGSTFRSTIPPEYSRIYDTLVAKGVIVRIIPPETNPWSALLLSWGLPLLFVFGSQCILTWCLYRAILSHLRRTPNGSAT